MIKNLSKVGQRGVPRSEGPVVIDVHFYGYITIISQDLNSQAFPFSSNCHSALSSYPEVRQYKDLYISKPARLCIFHTFLELLGAEHCCRSAIDSILVLFPRVPNVEVVRSIIRGVTIYGEFNGLMETEDSKTQVV